MNELDRKIRESLRKEDLDLFGDAGDEPSVVEMLMETFRGRHRWINVLGALWTLVFLVLGVVAAVNLFRAEAVQERLLWAVGCLVCVSIVAMLKIWYWLEIQKNALMREIKRLELQVARLAGKIKEPKGE